MGLVKFLFFFFFRTVVEDRHVRQWKLVTESRCQRVSHISDRVCPGGGGLVCICMSAVGHSMTCGMNRKCVEDTAFITWKLSALEFGAHHSVSCLVGGRVAATVSGTQGVVSSSYFDLKTGYVLNEGFCGLPQSLQAKGGLVPEMRPQPPLSTCFIH